jgi:hypothetical protein
MNLFNKNEDKHSKRPKNGKGNPEILGEVAEIDPVSEHGQRNKRNRVMPIF